MGRLCSMYPDRHPRCGSDSARTIRPVLPSPEGDLSHMPGPGPDQRDQRAQRNRRPRRRAPIGGGGRAPVTEFEEQQELEAARERNDLEVGDLREMSRSEERRAGKEGRTWWSP